MGGGGIFHRPHVPPVQPTPDETNTLGYYQQLRNEGRLPVEEGTSQLGQLSPYFLQNAGLDVTTQDNSPNIAQLTAQRDQFQQHLNNFATMSPKDRKALAKQLGVKNVANLKGFLQKNLQSYTKQAGDAQANPTTITGIKQSPEQAAQVAAENQNLDTANTRYQQAVSGNLPDILSGDPALKRQMDIANEQTQERLRRNFGTQAGADTSSAGIQAQADQSERNMEAASDAARQNIQLYGGLSMAQGAQNLSNTAQRNANASFSPTSQIQAGGALGSYGTSTNTPLLNYFQGNRQLEQQRQTFNQSQPTTAQSLLSGLSPGKALGGLFGRS